METVKKKLKKLCTVKKKLKKRLPGGSGKPRKGDLHRRTYGFNH